MAFITALMLAVQAAATGLVGVITSIFEGISGILFDGTDLTIVGALFAIMIAMSLMFFAVHFILRLIHRKRRGGIV